MPTRRQVALSLMAGVVVGLLAEISINPFGTAFRFSLGPVGLAVFTLFFMLPAHLIGLAAGLIVPLVHGLFAWATSPGLTPAQVLPAVSTYVPELWAYSLLGLLLHLFQVQSRTHSPIRLALLLSAADFLTNAMELALRPEVFEPERLAVLALVAVGRAAVAEGSYYILQEGVRERQWAEERRAYTARLLLASNLQTEAFFLRKSAKEIEQIMAKAHRLYRKLAGHERQPLALEIAKDIHEVKKDYQRTLGALYRLVEVPKLEPEMNLTEIVALVIDANQSYAGQLGKAITVASDLRVDFRTPRFGRWVSILNNLVSNAIEACSSVGSVTVAGDRIHGKLVLRVRDTGSGIPEEDWEMIFEPGFSTKINPVTGAYSSGIGLTHVAGLVEAMGGTIRVERSSPVGTVLRLEVPWDQLEAVEQGE